jgi:competence ComEA-like helix-hairpin-helix protein
MNKTHPVHPIFRALTLTLLFALTLSVVPVLAADGPGVVNINEAGESQLSLLPRVGPALAARIAAFREENGKFEAAEDLMLVRGIGEKSFQLLEAYVTVEGKTTLTQKVKVSDAQARLEEKDSSS